jgi:Bacteriophage tail sheath protein
MSVSRTTTPWTPPSAAGIVERIDRQLRDDLAWASSLPNGEVLWRAVRQEAEELLERLWRGGELVGSSPSEAYFVRCGQDTMSEDDIENGRLVLVVGVATARPAEFEPIEIDRKVGLPLRRSPIEE